MRLKKGGERGSDKMYITPILHFSFYILETNLHSASYNFLRIKELINGILNIQTFLLICLQFASLIRANSTIYI